MSESNAPIFIIVGTLVSVTTIAISTGLLHDFASSSAEHEDRHEFNRLLNSLESQCENVEASQDTRFSTTEEIDLRDAEIELSVSDDPKLIYHSDERDLSEDINCEPDIETDFDFGEESDGGFIPIGNHQIYARENDNEAVEVTNH